MTAQKETEMIKLVLSTNNMKQQPGYQTKSESCISGEIIDIWCSKQPT